LLSHWKCIFRTNSTYNKHETRLYEKSEIVSMTTVCLHRKVRDEIDRFVLVSTYAVSNALRTADISFSVSFVILPCRLGKTVFTLP
jgi:hypothetical protein